LPKAGNPKPKAAVLVPLLLSSLVGFSTSARAQSSSAGAPPRGVQLVIPFENQTREPRAYWLSEGSAVLMTDALRALGVQAIAREARLLALERLRVPAVVSLSRATIIRVGEVVGAGQIIIGSFEVQGDQLVVRARALKLDTGRLTPEVVGRGALNDMFELYSSVARRLPLDVKPPQGQPEPRHPPVAAFEQYIKGLLADTPAAQVSFLTQAVRLAPDYQRARLALWKVYEDQNDHQHALDEISQVPIAGPESRRARFLAGISLLQLARYQDAFDALTVLNNAKADAALWNNLGVIQIRRPAGGPGGKAPYYFDQAAKIDDTDPDLFFNLGYAYWLERDTRAAVYWLREAVRRNPADHEAHYVLSAALQASGSTAEAAREKELAHRLSSVYGELEAKQPKNDPVPRGLERLKRDIDDADAIRVQNVLVEAERRDQQELVTSYLDRGRRLFQAQRDTEAIAELRRAVYLAPYQSEAHLLLGRIYLRAGRAQEAVEAFKIALWSDDTPEAHLALAEAYVRMKDPNSARSELEGVLARDPANGAARRQLEELK